MSIGLTSVGRCVAFAREKRENVTVMFQMIIFVLFNKPEHAQFFLEYINKKHKNIRLSNETEINGSLSFLDVKVFHENEK